MTWWIVMAEADAAFWAPVLGCPGDWTLLDLAELAGVPLDDANEARGRAVELGMVEKATPAPRPTEDEDDPSEDEDPEEEDEEVKAAGRDTWTLTATGIVAIRKWPAAVVEAERWAAALTAPLSGREILVPIRRRSWEDPSARGLPVPVKWIPGPRTPKPSRGPA